jgi:hypothetical protein
MLSIELNEPIKISLKALQNQTFREVLLYLILAKTQVLPDVLPYKTHS